MGGRELMKYRKKPVVIEAIQWTTDNWLIINAFANTEAYTIERDILRGTLKVATTEGVMTAKKGDWIIKGVKGEFYPCRNDIFEATYEPV